MSHTPTCALDPDHTHEFEEEDHDHDHDHSHGPFVDRSIIRSRAGIKAVSLSLVVLTITAAAQTAIYVLVLSVALLADLIHNFGDALTAIPLGLAFFLRSARGERWAGFAVVLHDLRQRVCRARPDDHSVHPSAHAHTPLVARGGRGHRFRRQRDCGSDSATRGQTPKQSRAPGGRKSRTHRRLRQPRRPRQRRAGGTRCASGRPDHRPRHHPRHPPDHLAVVAHRLHDGARRDD